jgi:hypothetical protein
MIYGICGVFMIFIIVDNTLPNRLFLIGFGRVISSFRQEIRIGFQFLGLHE